MRQVIEYQQMSETTKEEMNTTGPMSIAQVAWTAI